MGTLFQWLITLTIKNVGHASNLNLSGSRFHPLDLVILFRVKFKSPLVPIILSLCKRLFSRVKLPFKYFVLFFLIGFTELWKITGQWVFSGPSSLCIFVLPGIYFSSVQPLLMVLTMHARSAGASAALEVHTQFLSSCEPLVYNEVSPSQYTTAGWGKILLCSSFISTEFSMYHLIPVGPVYCLIQVSFMTVLISSSYTITLWWCTNCFTQNQTLLMAKKNSLCARSRFQLSF